MYATFNWAFEAPGASGLIEYASNLRNPTNVEVINSPRPSTIPKTPSTAYMTPKLYPGDGPGIHPNKLAWTQLRSYHDVGVSVDLRSPFNPRKHRDFGGSNMSPLQAKGWNKARSMSTENGVVQPGFSKRDRELDGDDCKIAITTDMVISYSDIRNSPLRCIQESSCLRREGQWA
jgi:hypothetical protein